MHLLMSRTLNEVFVLNSIPEAFLEDIFNKKSDQGLNLLGSYYKYAQAIQNADPEAQKLIVEQFRTRARATSLCFSG